MNQILERLEKLGTLHANTCKGTILNNEKKWDLQDISLFSERFSCGSIFGWKLCSTKNWFSPDYNVNKYLLGESSDGGVDYLENFYVIATSAIEKTIHIAIDLNPQRFGYIGLFWYQGDLNWGGYPLVAKSFGEWLLRTLDHGDQNGSFYWESPNFVDLGPAIPNDPSYRPIIRPS